MKKTLFFLTPIFIFAVLFLFKPQQALAQAASTQNWVCLNAVRCDRKEANCTIPSDKSNYSGVHRVKLTLPDDTVIPASNTNFIAECFSARGSNEQVCTTGKIIPNSGLITDEKALAEVAKNYTFQGLYGADGLTGPSNNDPMQPGPVATNASGKLPELYWQDSTEFSVSRRFYIIRGVALSAFTEGNEGGQQQATFFTALTNNSCSSVAFDPYGFVFDSKSLEPIPFQTEAGTPITGSEVRLYAKNATGSYASASFPLVQNPQYPLADGLFNFVVPDGTYKLEVRRQGYMFPADKTMLNSNYSKIYSDIYPVVGGLDDGYAIVQVGKIQHRDIPLDPIDGVGKEYPVELVKYFYNRESEYSSKVIVEGWASHPFTKVKAYSVASTEIDTSVAIPVTILGEVKSDKVGHFKLEIDQMRIGANEKFGTIILEKSKLTDPTLSYVKEAFDYISGLFIKSANAQVTTSPVTVSNTTQVGFDPIPTYLEGIAKDSTGRSIPNAKVNIVISGNTMPYYSTTADATGYFKVTSEYIPMMAYTVEYVTSTGKKISVDTSTLVAENATGSAKPSYTYRDSRGQGVTISPTTSVADTNPVISDVPAQTPDQQVQSPVSYFLIIVIVILLLLGISGVILGIYLLKKKEV